MFIQKSLSFPFTGANPTGRARNSTGRARNFLVKEEIHKFEISGR